MTESSRELTVHEKRLVALAEKRRELFTIREEEALDYLVSAREALPLVHSCPEEDFFFLMHRIGAEDFLPVLGMAKERHWQYILDQEIWTEDVPDLWEATRWYAMLFAAAPDRFVEWMGKEKVEELDYYLSVNYEVRIREHDEDPSDFGDGFETVDDVVYYRLKEPSDAEFMDTHTKTLRENFLTEFMKGLAGKDHERFMAILTESSAVIRAEAEEDALRWRNVRLAERGFMPPEDAVAIFRPLVKGELEADGRKVLREAMSVAEMTAVPGFAGEALRRDATFSDALSVFEDDGIPAELFLEMAALCNRLISADKTVIRAKEALDVVVEMALAYLRIGVARVSGENAPSARTMATVLKNYRLEHVFRAGYGEIMRVKWAVERWKKEAWFLKSGLPLTFWGERWVGTLAGFLLERPKAFDPQAKTGTYYGEFETAGDVDAAIAIVNDIMAMDDVLALLGITEVDPQGRYLDWKNLLLTLWARFEMDGLDAKAPVVPLELPAFRPVYASWWEEETGDRVIPDSVKGRFLSWLAKACDITAADLADRVGPTLEALFEEILQELGPVRPESLDPRFAILVLL